MAGACVLLFDNQNRLLLQRRTDNGLWGSPGGALEPGEKMEEVAMRGLYEETGLIAERLHLFDVFSGNELYYRYPHGDEVFNLVTVYICKEYKGTLRSDGIETKEVKFFDLWNIPKDLSPPEIPVINKLLKEKMGSLNQK